MFIKKDLLRNPISKFGKFYNSYSESNQKYIELLAGLGRGLVKEMVIFSKSIWKGKHRLSKIALEWYSPSATINSSTEPVVTWIGHSSFLIQMENVNILTDPIFTSPSALFPRILKPGIELSKLPKIDYILISHNHWDHMSKACLSSVRERFPQVKFLVPKGDGYWLNKWGLKSFCEFDWWQRLSVPDVNFTFLPAHHWSQRSLFDQNKSLWGSWMVEGNSKKVYFAGDTAYGSHFKEIQKCFSKIDIALMPVGPCEPERWMCKSHMNAEDACKAFLELDAKSFVPMHWGTFHFGTDNFDTPIIRLEKWWQQNKSALEAHSLSILKFGHSSKF